jgi:hypothetical protein
MRSALLPALQTSGYSVYALATCTQMLVHIDEVSGRSVEITAFQRSRRQMLAQTRCVQLCDCHQELTAHVDRSSGVRLESYVRTHVLDRPRLLLVRMGAGRPWRREYDRPAPACQGHVETRLRRVA